jgi:hypothetical protein
VCVCVCVCARACVCVCVWGGNNRYLFESHAVHMRAKCSIF